MSLARDEVVLVSARRWARWRVALQSMSFAALAIGGCDCNEEESRPPAESTIATGIVEGVVRFAEDAELPAYTEDFLNPNDATPPAGCPGITQADLQPIGLEHNRGLDGIVVAAAEFGRAPAYEPSRHEVILRNCRLHPRTLVASIGDVVVVKNEDSQPWLPQLGATIFAQAVLAGQSREFPIERGGTTALYCGGALSRFCGRTDIVVTAHPVITLTGVNGRFRLDNVPAGPNVQIGAWHPLLEANVVTVNVEAGQTHPVEIVLEPVPPPPQGVPEVTDEPNFSPEVY